MKICYALRRGVFYPSQRDAFGETPPREHRPRYLKKLRDSGFDGVEIGLGGVYGSTEREAKDLAAELRDAGVPVVCIRGGGPIAHPKDGAATRERMRRVVEMAGWLGASVVNTTIVMPVTQPDGPGAEGRGEATSQGASRYATEADFVETARHLREVGRQAADLGLDLAIEIHQRSIADNSWSGLHLVDLIDLPNVGVNPDLGNIYWQFDVPEETCESAIVALAPKSKYWHCKNLKRIHIPDLNRSFFLRVPLDLGDIDYRFAISAMKDAGYQGYLSVEGVYPGDQLTQDARSAAYVREVLAEL